MTKTKTLKIQWQKLDVFMTQIKGIWIAMLNFKQHLDTERLYDILASFNWELDEVCRRIRGRRPLLSTGEAFAKVLRENNRRVILIDKMDFPSMAVSGNRLLGTSAMFLRINPPIHIIITLM